VREDPNYAEPIGAMLTFLCPAKKAAVTGEATTCRRLVKRRGG